MTKYILLILGGFIAGGIMGIALGYILLGFHR